MPQSRWTAINNKLSKIDQRIALLREKRKKTALKQEIKVLNLLKKYNILEKDITEIESILQNGIQQTSDQTQQTSIAKSSN